MGATCLSLCFTFSAANGHILHVYPVHYSNVPHNWNYRYFDRRSPRHIWPSSMCVRVRVYIWVSRAYKSTQSNINLICKLHSHEHHYTSKPIEIDENIASTSTCTQCGKESLLPTTSIPNVDCAMIKDSYADLRLHHICSELVWLIIIRWYPEQNDRVRHMHHVCLSHLHHTH